MSTASRWALALIIALALGLSWQLDGPNDIEAAQDQSDALTELQAAAPGSARQQAAAQRLCREERGPNSEARFLPEGHLVCTMRRGLVTAQAQP
ncbi:hypothetical protein [Polaromonas jejuensis]|uniref:Uncharacterized protein n=1 Tax=Polaromonas jejuensis TaxID=457502 RepID=A0ABW0QKA5_9BURK|nr:hypothetical protein [Polaromonas jejuensis]